MKCQDCEFHDDFKCDKNATITNTKDGFGCDYEDIKKDEIKTRFAKFPNLFDLSQVVYVQVSMNNSYLFLSVKYQGGDEIGYNWNLENDDLDNAYKNINAFYKAIKERKLYEWGQNES